MTLQEEVLCGVAGCGFGLTGTAMSLQDWQLIISIVATILSFLIGVLIPLIIKLVKIIKEARADGIIDDAEKENIKNTVNEILDESKKEIDEVKDKINKNNKL